MRSIIMLVTLAGRRLAADGVPLIGSRYARRLLVLSATLTAAVVVGVLGYATSARADVACGPDYCGEKTATPDPVKVGEQLTFTITGSCVPGQTCGVTLGPGLTDTLPAGLEFVSASTTGASSTCSESAGTVTCAPFVFGSLGSDVVTIVVIPRQCGTFTNTATLERFLDSDDLPVPETFTVEGCPDTTDPTLKVSHAGANANGWNNTSPVTVNVSASDTGSGLAGAPTCTDGTTGLTLTAGTAGNWTASVSGEGSHTISCSVTDKAGNSTSATDTVNIDTKAPTISDLGPTTTANANGWFNTDVTNRFGATDSGSGLSAACLASFAETGNTQSKTTSGEGTAVKVTSDSCTDLAGNTAKGIDSATFQIDKSAPSTSCSVSPSTLRVPANNHKLVSIKATVTVTDNTGGSGANGFTLVSVTSNQPQSGLAKDDVPNDIQGWDIGKPDTSGQVRAERYGGPRIYTLTYRGYDLAGNPSKEDCSATVTMPKGG